LALGPRAPEVPARVAQLQRSAHPPAWPQRAQAQQAACLRCQQPAWAPRFVERLSIHARVSGLMNMWEEGKGEKACLSSVPRAERGRERRRHGSKDGGRARPHCTHAPTKGGTASRCARAPLRLSCHQAHAHPTPQSAPSTRCASAKAYRS
jgi:hypothetical protein